MQNRKDSLILKQKGNYIPLLKHGESVQVNEERGYCCPRIAKSRSKSKNIAGTVPQEKLQKQEIYTEKRTDNCKSLSNDMLPSYRTMKYKSPIWGYFHVQKE